MNLPDMPPYRDIYFCVYLETDTRPIFIPLYRMDPTELRDLKAKIHEFFFKVLFVKNKKGSKRNGEFILINKKVDWYRNDKLMNKESYIEYIWVKEIEDFSKKVCINNRLVL